MSHPVTTHDRDNEYPSDNYHSSGPKKLNHTQRTMGKLLKEAGKSVRGRNENHLSHLKRVSKSKALESKKN